MVTCEFRSVCHISKFYMQFPLKMQLLLEYRKQQISVLREEEEEVFEEQSSSMFNLICVQM